MNHSKKLGLLFSSVLLLGASFVNADDVKKGVNWEGDFRYRHEYVNFENPAAGGLSSTYNQQRIRARIGADATVNENTTTEIRLTTAPGRTSTNQTLGASADAFANYAITLDRAGFNWKANNFYSLSGGRIGNKYFEPGESDLVWDLDLNFDGLLLALNHGNENCRLFLNTSYFWIDKSLSASTQDVVMTSVQVGVSHQMRQDMSWTAGINVHHISNLYGHALLSTPIAPNGNTVTTSGAVKYYATNFNLVNPGIEFRTNIINMPVVFMIDYVVNGNAHPDNAGYLAGFRIGKVKKAGDFGFNYDYRELQKDAAVASFTDADSFGGGTDGHGHRVAVLYQVASNWTTALTGYIGQAGIADGETSVRRDKVHADLIFKF